MKRVVKLNLEDLRKEVCNVPLLLAAKSEYRNSLQASEVRVNKISTDEVLINGKFTKIAKVEIATADSGGVIVSSSAIATGVMPLI